MSRRPKHDDPNVIPFRPKPKPSRTPARWERSLKFFLILLAGIGLIRALFVGMSFDCRDLLFVVLLAGAIAYGDSLARRR